MTQKTLLIWFRYELRLFDNPLLAKDLLSRFDRVVPLFIIDPSQFKETRAFGLARWSFNRARFLLESLEDLRTKLMNLGSNLIVRFGAPEIVLDTLAKEVEATDAIWCRHVGTEEERDSHEAMTALEKRGVTVHPRIWDTTMLHPDDLPYADLKMGIPDSFISFRKAIETRNIVPRECIASPKTMPPLPPILNGKEGHFPALEELVTDKLHGWAQIELGESFQKKIMEEFDIKTPPRFPGGETAGLARMKTWMWDKDLLKKYKETRDGLLGDDYASHMSPYLSLGCTSARTVYWEVKQYELSRKMENDVNTYWMVFELMWRDYFKFVGLKLENLLFRLHGIFESSGSDSPPWLRDAALFRKWVMGETGYPLVDAAMNELRITGFMGNRARQIVASFLTKDMGLDWRLGAEWFEAMLVDSDVSINYGNWQYQAGVANDPHELRYFNVTKQTRQFDSDGSFRQKWCGKEHPIPCLPQLGLYAPKISERIRRPRPPQSQGKAGGVRRGRPGVKPPFQPRVPVAARG